MKWSVLTMKCYPEYEGEPDVVFNVGWSLSETEVDGEKTYTGYIANDLNIALQQGVPFTPFNELTEDQVIGWVKENLGAESVASYEASVLAQIEQQKNPPVINPPLPW